VITHHDLAQLSLAAAPFDRAGWIFELKHDGFRMLAVNRPDRAELVSRRGNDFADRFPEIVDELIKLPDVILDCELVMVDAEGRSDFERLARRSRLRRAISIQHGARTAPACLFAFDLLELDGKDLRERPLTARKAALKKVVSSSKRIRYTDHVEHDGIKLFLLAEELGLEGIVAKRADAPYPCGGRSKDWVKIKTPHGRHIEEERSAWNEL
jgi:bifunctional non-homologous end joining protein LigD